ncbi:MAG: glycosyltransferase [Anaerolineae bacterium]
MEFSSDYPLQRIAVIGGFLPRQCGIATFTTDLSEALAQARPDTHVVTVAVNDTETGYDYPPRVRFEMLENELASFRRAADYLNLNNTDLVCLQHEYGIYGGPAGSHILSLLRDLRTPVVTTLHTVLHDPEPEYRQVMLELAELSDRLVVMSQRGEAMLQEVYGIPGDKIDLIPHGIPDVPFVDPNFYKDQFRVEGKHVLLTFGLLSRNKGIEHVIGALPAIVQEFPNLVYIVLGATHPAVRRTEGESYRQSLERLARDLGVEQNVIFHNRFVSLEELVEFIGVADIYITPYLNEAQIVSGTLAYSVGAGKAVVSTPYWYAEELLADGRGVLVPFGNVDAISQAVRELLSDESKRHAMRKSAYLLGRGMIWPAVAERYYESFGKARQQRTSRSQSVLGPMTLASRGEELPELNLNYLRHMTDNTGMLQHAVYTVPDYNHGYCTDDNARALTVAIMLEGLGPNSAREANRLASRYLAFLWHAYNAETGRFRNFMGYDRTWLEEVGSEDSHGRALWALGTVLGRTEQEGLRGLAGRLFSETLPVTLELGSPRAWAFALLGIHEYLRNYFGDSQAQQLRVTLAERLMTAFQENSAPDWPWFEDKLTYCNAVLPHALLLAGRWLDRNDMVEAGFRALHWLADLQRTEEGFFAPIGSNGFYPRGGERALFDQQPVEAQAMVLACLEAHRVSDDPLWRREAQRAFEWFLGRNALHVPLYDPVTGGCRDGLHSDRANQNQGAESTLAFLISLLDLRLSELAIRVPGVGYAKVR